LDDVVEEVLGVFEPGAEPDKARVHVVATPAGAALGGAVDAAEAGRGVHHRNAPSQRSAASRPASVKLTTGP
jgi:hypothetical protein